MTMINKKKIFKIIATTLILLTCFFVGLYILGVKSEPYRFALEYIDTNETISASIGTLKSNYLSFGGYSVRYEGSHGWAEFAIKTSGEKGKGVVFIKLEKELGKWEVSAARLKLESGEFIDVKTQIDVMQRVKSHSSTTY